MMNRHHLVGCGLLLLLAVFLGTACQTQPAVLPAPTPTATPRPPSVEVVTPTATSQPPPVAALPTPSPEPPTLSAVDPADVCGLYLPTLPGDYIPSTPALAPDAAAVAALRAAAPAAAWPAIERILEAPGSVGLALYEASQPDRGAYLNPDQPMPIVSVTKIIILVAYAEAVAAGELDPFLLVPVSELDRFYLPNFDLGAHRRAINELRTEGRVINPDSDDAAITLDDVVYIMIRHSSNAASDYLHDRFGQERIEQTALGLGFDSTSHSAPCTFLGQFLLMGNHTRGTTGDQTALEAYLTDEKGAAAYGADLVALFNTYTTQTDFRANEVAWRQATRRPTMDTQRFFAEHLAVQATARSYANLMARLAQNGLSNPDSSYIARRHLEWPMQFPVNQDSFSNLGYKNGSLPGVLATVYYGYRLGQVDPVIIALYYRDLPQQTYRRWRFDLPHDELARWLLAEPQAIDLLGAVLKP